MSTTNEPMETTPSRTGDNTVTASPNLKGQEVQEKVPGGASTREVEPATEADVEKGTVVNSTGVNEEDLIQGTQLAIVWSAFLL
jgi:hypothetical protein